MEILDAIFTRRSIRKYSGKPVDQKMIQTILKAGFYAPSAYNQQPWQYVVIKNPQTLESISQAHTYAKMLPQAGNCIIVCGDKEKEGMLDFLLVDCAAAIENMLLAAHGLGLGAVWCALYPDTILINKLKMLLDLPGTIVPVGMVVIGQKSEEKVVDERYDETKVHYEKW